MKRFLIAVFLLSAGVVQAEDSFLPMGESESILLKNTVCSPLPCPEILPVADTRDLIVTWGPEMRLSIGYYGAACPRLAIYKNAVYVVWHEARSGLNRKAFIRSSFDRGSTWSNTRLLSPIDMTTHDTTPVVAAWLDDVVVASRHQITLWDGTGFCSGIGQNWQNLILQTLHPAITIEGSYINVVCSDGSSILHRLSTDGGASFQPTHSLASFEFVASQPIRMISSRRDVYLVYCANPYNHPADIFFQASYDSGRNFTPPVMLSTDDSHHSQCPALACTRSGKVYVAWMDYKYSPYWWTGDIILRQSSDFGCNWREEILLNHNHLARTSAIAAQDSQVHAVMEFDAPLQSSESELFFRYSEDYGTNWSDSVRLTFHHGYSQEPDLAFRNDTLHLVWQEGGLQSGTYRRAVITHIPRTLPDSEIANPMSVSVAITPNPANPTTTIGYELRATSYVSLKIYDTSGRLVTTLVNEFREAGNHEAFFDGSNLASGVYLYRLELSGSGATPTTTQGKIVLMK